ncbi:MAG TPA: phosphoribosylaminoimidazolesuccinocarboxamide synthase [Deltaproteobacteria bacterium]|nr:phosphoribosylaminoimidazolesuccinocarboxamide synthase [Deltaproteobacteria bacterium]
MNLIGLTETHLADMELISRGKVRDIYELDNYLLIVASDRISAFDVIMPNPIPDKGRILTRMSVFWFDKMKDIVDNHLVETDTTRLPAACKPYAEILAGRTMLVKKARQLPVECIIRGYLSGSAWKDYRQGMPVSGIRLPDGLKESAQLSEPIFTPSTKADVGDHDVPISRREMETIIGRELTEAIIDISMNIYERASHIADQAGIIIADTKLEFGIIDDRLILIDELLTPDSSRFWPKEDYEEGRSQKSYDKQYLRDYLLSIDWDQHPPAPNLPDDVILKTKEKYEEALKRLLK